MRILTASDHRGFTFKNFLITELAKKLDVVDLGPHSKEMVDYPDFSDKLALELKPNDFGILICGSGLGMSIAANRHPHIRGALCRTIKDSISARKHNNANVLILGSDVTTPEEGIEITSCFLKTKFEEGRHQFRLNKINKKGN